MGDRVVTLFLCGDVMTGRGVDQILPHPGDPALRERYIRDARDYVRLAGQASGPVPVPAGPGYVWGDALDVLARAAPDARVINLETSVTARGRFARGKGVHYRMHPANSGCLAPVRPGVCTVANNHVLDFGRAGLADTLAALSGAGLAAAGAGPDLAAAQRPAVLPLAGGGRVLVFGCGAASSGIPPSWAAGRDRPGVAYLPALTDRAAADLAGRIRAARRPGDIVVVSIHWGPNWGYEVTGDEVRFARAVIDRGADLVHGHSSHHPRPAEVYAGKLILYGCGDFIDDYEGISGYEEYRDDLRLAYLVSVRAGSGALAAARMVPLQASRMRLRRTGGEGTRWLAGTLNRAGRRFGTRVEPGPGGVLGLRA